MINKKFIAAAFLGGSALAGLSYSAEAAEDATLAAPGFYNGTNNPSTDFTTSVTGEVELGLRARFRFGANVTPTGSTYEFSTGVQPSGTSLWNYDFSINLGDSGLTLASLTSATLTILDTNTSVSNVVNVLTYWGDSATYSGSAGAPVVSQNGLGLASLDSQLGIQNSENLAFDNSPLAGDFNPWAGDQYQFTLAVAWEGGESSTSMTVNTVPEPATMTLLGAGLFGLIAARRKRTV